MSSQVYCFRVMPLNNHGKYLYKLTKYSNIATFIGYINKSPIYFNLHMHIDEQIISIIPKWIQLFIQYCGAYIKHKNSCIVSRHNFFSEKNT